MFAKSKLRIYQCVAIATISMTLVACGSDNDLPTPPEPPPAPVNVSYEVTVTNLTNAQPLSPAAVILHQTGNLFVLGEPASVALETMAEGGDNSGLLGLPIVAASASGAAPIGPGASETITVTIEDTTDAKLSVATMLVNTNDGFTGLNALELSDFAVGDTWSNRMRAYDSGTEANSEAVGTMPGPADGGTGFESARDDVDFVAAHPGVVTSSDNLPTSVLTSQHKFDNPVISITVTRIE